MGLSELLFGMTGLKIPSGDLHISEDKLAHDMILLVLHHFLKGFSLYRWFAELHWVPGWLGVPRLRDLLWTVRWTIWLLSFAESRLLWGQRTLLPFWIQVTASISSHSVDDQFGWSIRLMIKLVVLGWSVPSHDWATPNCFLPLKTRHFAIELLFVKTNLSETF